MPVPLYAWDHAACLCEHEDHFSEDGPAGHHVQHPYGAERPVMFWCGQITGPVCTSCANNCLAEWREDHPDDVFQLPSRPSLTAPGAGA